MSVSAAVVQLPQKRFYRQRAHSNPIADHCFDYPAHPNDFDWSKLYPDYNKPAPSSSADDDANAATTTETTNAAERRVVEFADIGCGYGGFLVKLGELHPDRLAIGMEIRVKVSDYVMDRIEALRLLHPGQYRNIACLRTNAMKYLPNFFAKHQLSKIFFLYPDPHFKRSKHKWRIISQPLLTEYSYVLRPGGIIYTITDVRDLHDWMVGHLERHELYERLTAEEEAADPITEKLYESSEEGLKVTRNKGDKFVAIYRRLQH